MLFKSGSLFLQRIGDPPLILTSLFSDDDVGDEGEVGTEVRQSVFLIGDVAMSDVLDAVSIATVTSFVA